MTYDPRHPPQPPQYPPQFGQQPPQYPPQGGQLPPQGYRPPPPGYGQPPYPPADTGASTTISTIAYVSMLAGLLVPFASIIGAILAYVNRGKEGPWLDTHHTWVIRTFWISILYFLGSIVLTIVLIGWLLLIATLVWYLWRLIKGLSALSRREPLQDPQTWWV